MGSPPAKPIGSSLTKGRTLLVAHAFSVHFGEVKPSPDIDVVIPVERYWRDARVNRLYEGTTQIQKLIIGRFAAGIDAIA